MPLLRPAVRTMFSHVHLQKRVPISELNTSQSSNSSSFPLAFPVIWGRRYGCWSSLSSKPCLLHRPLSVLQSACPSCTHPSTLSFVSLSSFSPVSLSSSLSSLRDLLPSSWRAHTISVFSPLSFWRPALLLSFLGCVRSWFCLFLSLHTSTSASSSRSPQSLIPVVWWWPRFQLHIAYSRSNNRLFYKPSPSASPAFSCHTTLHCISSSSSTLLPLASLSQSPSLLPPQCSSPGTWSEWQFQLPHQESLLVVGFLGRSVRKKSPWTGSSVYWPASPSLPRLSSTTPGTLSCPHPCLRTTRCRRQTASTLGLPSSPFPSARPSVWGRGTGLRQIPGVGQPQHWICCFLPRLYAPSFGIQCTCQSSNWTLIFVLCLSTVGPTSQRKTKNAHRHA